MSEGARDENPLGRLADIVAFPTRGPHTQMRLAGNLFHEIVRFPRYKDGEKLDLWLHLGNSEDGPEVPPDEAISGFRWSVRESGEKTYGPWCQYFNINYEFLPLTVIHELSHVVDCYHVAPRTVFSSHREDIFRDLNVAYVTTRSCVQMFDMKSRLQDVIRALGAGELDEAQKRLPKLLHSSGVKHPVIDLDDPKALNAAEDLYKRTVDALSPHEIFARCLTAHVVFALKDVVTGPLKRYKFVLKMYSERSETTWNYIMTPGIWTAV